MGTRWRSRITCEPVNPKHHEPTSYARRLVILTACLVLGHGHAQLFEQRLALVL